MSARIVSTVAALLLAAPLAAAQDHSQHTQHQHAPPAKEAKPAPAPAPAKKPKPKPKPKAAAKPAAAPVDHSQVDHSQMDHSQMDHGAAPAPVPAPTDADRAAAQPPTGGHAAHDQRIHSYVLFDQVEGFASDGRDGAQWSARAWIGNDEHRLWLRSEGEQRGGELESAELEAMYARPIARWWDLGVGIRHDFRPGDAQDFLALGVQGTAPYKIEVAATAYLGSGQAAARLEAEYDTLFSNRLILQSRAEVDLYGQDDPDRGIGAGLAQAGLGLRLRYEVTRQFAPYVGIEREWALGRSGDYRALAGEARNETRLVAGLRFWF